MLRSFFLLLKTPRSKKQFRWKVINSNVFIKDLQRLINAYRSDMINLSVSNQILTKRSEHLAEKVKALNTHDQLGMPNWPTVKQWEPVRPILFKLFHKVLKASWNENAKSVWILRMKIIFSKINWNQSKTRVSSSSKPYAIKIKNWQVNLIRSKPTIKRWRIRCKRWSVTWKTTCLSRRTLSNWINPYKFACLPGSFSTHSFSMFL